MRAVRYHEFGGPEKLLIEQIPQPELDGRNVLTQITRAGVSPLDDKVRRGILPPTMRKPLPLVPGASAVGRVADPGASGHAPGTRVLLCGWGYGTKLDGTWREFAAVPSSHLVPIPDGVSNDDAAGLVAGAGYLTAWLALTKVVPLRPGQIVLAPGIYGAVASAAAQVAPILGASQVISTALVWKTARLQGFLLTRFTQQELADTYRTLLEHVAAHALKPAIDRVYPLDHAAEAQRRVVEDRPFGRVLLDPQT